MRLRRVIPETPDIMMTILWAGFLGLVIALVCWVLALLAIRAANFKADGTRFEPARGGERRSQEIEYHNNAVYRDFEYFFKVTLGILGGVAYVSTAASVRSTDAVNLLIRLGGPLQLASGIVFSLFVFFHQKSKVERWTERFLWWKTVTWQECYMVVAMIAISSAVCFGFIPQLVTLLSSKS